MKKNKPFLLKAVAAHQSDTIPQQKQMLDTNADAYPKDEYLDKQDILQMFKISPKTLYRWRKENLITFTGERGKIFYSGNALRRRMQERISKSEI